MSDFIAVLNMLGWTPVLLGIVIAFGSIALYFGFIKKS